MKRILNHPYLAGGLLLFLLAGIGICYFFTHGYDYTLPQSSTLSQDTYRTSDACIQQQATKTALEAPILAQMEPLAAKLIHDPLPLPDGQATYDTYAKLREQINQLETKYAC